MIWSEDSEVQFRELKLQIKKKLPSIPDLSYLIAVFLLMSAKAIDSLCWSKKSSLVELIACADLESSRVDLSADLEKKLKYDELILIVIRVWSSLLIRLREC